MFQRLLQPPGGSFFLFGPRGTGKTTWIRHHFKAAPCYDLLNTSEALRLNREPAAFGKECAALKEGDWIVVDEVQKAPLLLDEVQRLIEERKQSRPLQEGLVRVFPWERFLRHLWEDEILGDDGWPV